MSEFGPRRCSAQVVDESWQGQFSGQLGMLPARVTLSLYFFQETRDKKKLVASLLKLHAYHDPRPEGVTADAWEQGLRRFMEAKLYERRGGAGPGYGKTYSK